MKQVFINRRQFDVIYPHIGVGDLTPNSEFIEWMNEHIGEGSIDSNYEHWSAGQRPAQDLAVDWETWWASYGGETDMSICFRTEEQAMKFLLRW